MNQPVPALRILIGLSLAGAGMAADDPGVNHEIRTQESDQRSVTAQTGSTAKDISEIADEYAYNHIGDQSQVAALSAIADQLAQISDPTQAGKSRNMPWVENRLTAARSSGDTKGELTKAAAGEEEILSTMNALISGAQKQFGAMQQRSDLQDVIEAQQKLQSDTEKLADQTLGKDNSELTPQQKIDQERIAAQQAQLKDKITQAADELKQAAAQATDPTQAQALKDTADQLAKQDPTKDQQAAADSIRDNKMQDAQQDQQTALDKLQNAQNTLSQTQPQTPDAPNAMDQLADQQAALDKLTSQQQQLKDDTQNAKPDNLAPLAQQQQDLAKQMQDNPQAADAAPHADQAQQDLAKNDQAQAEQQQQQALDKLAQASQALQQKMDDLQNQQLQALDQQLTQVAAMQQAESQLQSSTQAMKPDASPEAFNALQAQQQDLSAQMADQKLSAQAQAHADQAAQNLGKMNQSQALAEEQAAMQSLDNEQKDLQEKLSKMQAKAAKHPKAAPPQAGHEENGALASKNGSGWQVQLQPQEREKLNSSSQENFPKKYEAALSQYYKDLAAGDDQGKAQ